MCIRDRCVCVCVCVDVRVCLCKCARACLSTMHIPIPTITCVHLLSCGCVNNCRQDLAVLHERRCCKAVLISVSVYLSSYSLCFTVSVVSHSRRVSHPLPSSVCLSMSVVSHSQCVSHPLQSSMCFIMDVSHVLSASLRECVSHPQRVSP